MYVHRSNYFCFVICSLSHLSVSNSTPPPATSPVSIKVKSEPQSPPRDLSGGHQHSNGSNLGSSNATNGSGGGAGGGGGGSTSHSSLNANNLNSSLSLNAGSLSVSSAVGVIAGSSPGGAGGGGGGGILNSGGASNSSSTSNGSANDQATNLSVLNHQQHLVMAGSRPSSTGHLTPTPGMLSFFVVICLYSYISMFVSIRFSFVNQNYNVQKVKIISRKKLSIVSKEILNQRFIVQLL